MNIHAPDGVYEAVVHDLGVGGMYLRTEEPLGYGTTIELRLQGVRIPAIVRWASPGGVGVQFGLLGPEVTRFVLELMKG